MGEHCGCQSSPAIEEVTREHDVALDHLRVARPAADHSDWDGSAGDLLVLPNSRHTLEALEAATVLLTVARHP